MLFKAQGLFQLNSTELVVLLNVLLHWWVADELPFPTALMISKRMGVSERTARRALSGLVEKEILAKVSRGQLTLDNPARTKLPPGTRTLYDPGPLVSRLNGMVPQYEEMELTTSIMQDELND